MSEIEAFIRGIPKAELHMHVEGALEPELVLELAERNGVRIRFGSVEELRAAYQFTNLQSFLDLYYECTGVLRTADDFRDLTASYLARARAAEVRHAEIFFDPQAHTARAVPFEAVITGIHEALDAARREHGMSSGLILCFLRHLDETQAMATFDRALPFAALLTGVGLDSSEVGHPPGNFTHVFERARAEGLHVVAHAGEEGPPDYITEALDVLRAERIDHGVRAIEDPALVERLARDQIPLTVCPLSNVKLGVFGEMKEHSLGHLLDAGVAVTINSDDPAYFGGYLVDNYLAAQQALGLGREEIRKIAANSFEAAFVGPARRSALLREVEQYGMGG